MKRNNAIGYGINFVLILGLWGVLACSGNDLYDDNSTKGQTIVLTRGGYQQFLVPVTIGTQVFLMLLDTGSNALLVFGDLIAKDNTQLEISNQEISKIFASTERRGFLAYAPVGIGLHKADRMRILVIQSPDSNSDPSLTLKKAQGVLGLRRTEGLSISGDELYLDVPLSVVQPSVSKFELNLPEQGEATLTLGAMPLIESANQSYVFKVKTYSLLDPVDKVTRSYSDLQVPFSIRSSIGQSSSDQENDILLDTGAVSRLVLDKKVAAQIGYDPVLDQWQGAQTELLDLSFLGPNNTLDILPKFSISEVRVSDYTSFGIQFEAILGIDRWFNYVVGFSFVDFQNGGPDGTILMMQRKFIPASQQQSAVITDERYIVLPGLNSAAEDKFPSISSNANFIAFQSNRHGGFGDYDVYVYQMGVGLLDLPDLNNSGDDSDPSISADGRYLVYHSWRESNVGDYDILLYDIEQKKLIELPVLNSPKLERTPSISADGRFIVFRSERDRINLSGNISSDIFMYDRKMNTLDSLSVLNTMTDFYDPSISLDGRYMVCEVFDDQDDGGSDILLINLLQRRFESIPFGADPEADEFFASVSADGGYISYTTNANNPQMGQYNRDLVIIDTHSMVTLYQPGLNSQMDEGAGNFSPDNDFFVFHSNRSDSIGNNDIFLFRLNFASEIKNKSEIENKIENNDSIDRGVIQRIE